MKGELLNYTDEQFFRAKPRFLALLEELEKTCASVPTLSPSQYVSDVSDMSVQHLPVSSPPVTCHASFQLIQFQYAQSQYSQLQNQQQYPSATGKPSYITLSPGLLGLRAIPSPTVTSTQVNNPVSNVSSYPVSVALAATSRVLNSSDVSLGSIGLSHFQGYNGTSSENLAYEEVN